MSNFLDPILPFFFRPLPQTVYLAVRIYQSVIISVWVHAKRHCGA